jgi:hypothetical protein
MEIKSLHEGKLSIGMKEYVKDAVEEFQEDVSRSAVRLPPQTKIFLK